ncbi:MAG TPA: S8 family serine peptidase [Pyrinomonadaceae bacterium]|nr:S8 family serine peptidase [Pyrinomonadaceae bacterium]
MRKSLRTPGQFKNHRKRPLSGLLATLVAFSLFIAMGVPAQMQVSSTEATDNQDSDSVTKVNRASDSGKNKTSKYIVRMSDEPVVAYKGGIPGLRATKPKKGTKIDPNSPDVTRYVSYLDARHDAALGKTGGRKVYDYRYTVSGFAAELTEGQAAKLAATPGVVTVERDEAQSMDTSTTASFLGLDAANGLWNQLGGVDNAGEDVIIGIVDSGIWPEHPSFSDRTGTGPNGQEGKLGYQQIPGWHGKCTPGEEFSASDCNQKLIGAQYFVEGSGLERIRPEEYISPRAYNSHGTHTASTAGGNSGVPATGIYTAFGNISGMAPRARIAAYKVCWDDGDPNTGDCFNSDSVAAIDQAVADGVDVINFSIGGSTTSFLTTVEIAFFFAAEAGVFVATSAGNNGPTAGTVAHASPWVTTVAAGTHPRSGDGSVKLGNGVTYQGASLTVGVGPAPVIRAQDAGLAGVHPDILRQCFSVDPLNATPNSPVLDPAKVAGKIVLCERGGATPVAANARVDKSLAVKNAGGVGMILANVAVNTLNADAHSVPTTHVDNVAYAAISSYVVANPTTATATIAQGVPNMALAAPLNASFSSRGPSAASVDQLKPDLTAPGQDVLAAVGPMDSGGRLFELYNGTSMASPHVAGLAALLKQQHPDWSPMAIKSALMTTGSNLVNFTPGLPNANLAFAQGAGHVRPNLAADPGLVYDSNSSDWLKFLCGTGQLTGCAPSDIIDPSDLNLPSIAVGDLVKPQTVTRTVRNVGSAPATYTATVTPFAGINVTVSPTSFTIQPGQTKSYTVTFAWANAPANNLVYQSGFLTWSDGTHSVRSPLVVRPVALLAPAAVNGTGAAGSTNFNITTGYTGPLTIEKRGLVAAVTNTDTVQDDPTDSFDTTNPDGNQGFKKFTFTVPAGTTLARFALFDDQTDGEDDLDLFVYRGATFVGSSNSSTSAETVSVTNPTAGTYTVYVHGWQTDETAGGPGANFTLFSWILGNTDAGNMTITAPAAVTPGTTYPITLSWTGLTPATKYLGTLTYKSGATTFATSVVRVDVP